MTRGLYYDPAVPPVDWGSRSPLVLANPEWLRSVAMTVADVERRLPRLDAHVWVATSGSSRTRPESARWVALSKDAFLASAESVNARLGAGAQDVWAHALPIFHVAGLGILARARLSGATVVAAVAEKWDAAAFHAAVAGSRATLSALVPPQVHDLVSARLASPPSLRAVVIGGARLEPALYAAARRLGWPCLPSYGLTETCSQVATAPLASLSDHGYPLILPVLAHAELRADDAGRLAVRATSLLTSYAEVDGDDTRAWDPKCDGWLKTDDLGRVGADGVEVFGRASDSVKVLGEWVSLPRVDEQAWRWAVLEGLTRIPGFDLATVAMPHPRMGQELVLAVTSGGVDAARRQALQASLAWFCRENLLPFERIHRVVWVEAIPHTPLGKLRRESLAAEVAAV
jgi:o-succinylbenzoate---CoA ligase